MQQSGRKKVSSVWQFKKKGNKTIICSFERGYVHSAKISLRTKGRWPSREQFLFKNWMKYLMKKTFLVGHLSRNGGFCQCLQNCGYLHMQSCRERDREREKERERLLEYMWH